MRKILLAVILSVFATSSFASEKPKQKAKQPYKPKTEFSKCDPIKAPEFCKSKVKKKAPKKSAEKKKK